MYKLKNPAKNLKLPVEITDSQYEDLTFWNKWKYSYFYKSLSKISPVNPYTKNYQSPITRTTTIVEDDSNSLLSNITNAVILSELLDSNMQNDYPNDSNTTSQPDAPVFDGFKGGDFGGGGSSGSWDSKNDSQTQDVQTSDNQQSDDANCNVPDNNNFS